MKKKLHIRSILRLVLRPSKKEPYRETNSGSLILLKFFTRNTIIVIGKVYIIKPTIIERIADALSPLDVKFSYR